MEVGSIKAEAHLAFLYDFDFLNISKCIHSYLSILVKSYNNLSLKLDYFASERYLSKILFKYKVCKVAQLSFKVYKDSQHQG